MPKYIFAYHGGQGMADTQEAIDEEMAKWGAWFGELGAAVVDGGNPTGHVRTVQSDGSVVDGGGANPLTGYSLIDAADLDDAVAKAGGCPVLASGGSVEVAETFDM
jgi:hypothetical protein